MQRQLESERDLSKIPSAQKRLVVKPLKYFLRGTADVLRGRDEVIAWAYDSVGCTIKEIGAHFDLHYSLY